MPRMANYLLTGAAGFIGMHVAGRLLDRGHAVLGVDSLNDYYSVDLKRDRLATLDGRDGWRFERVDLADRDRTANLFARERFDVVVNLAAQAGVRHSLTHPHDYIAANVVGFQNVLEGCRSQIGDPSSPDARRAPHLVYASSSSVYGANPGPGAAWDDGTPGGPFAADGPADHPLSLYAATKRANELTAHCYAHLYGLPCTGLRFFTVYGPWGRPDMAMWRFTERMLEGEPIDVYGEGDMRRDFTYVDDVAEGVVRVCEHPPTPAGPHPRDPSAGTGPARVYNIGNHTPVELTHLIAVLEGELGVPAKKNLLPMQPGDVRETCADVSALSRDVGFAPDTPIEQGVAKFVAWYRGYHDLP